MIRPWGEVQPDAPALISHGKEILTYGNLERRMDAIRRSLNQCGFGRADRIAIPHSGGIDMAVLMLGIISGATVLPINPDCTAHEIEADFHKRRALVLVVETALETPGRAVAERLGIPVSEFSPGEDCPMLSGGVPGREHDTGLAQPEDAIAVHLTSGTTDSGKVAPVCHIQLQENEQRFGVEDCVYLFGPLYYCSRPNTLTRSLLSGARVIVAPSFDVEDFYAFLSTYGITKINASPAVLMSIHAHAAAHKASIAKSQLKCMYIQAGKLDPRIAQELEALFRVPVLECYATSETSRIFANPMPPGRRKRGTVGLPLRFQAYIRTLDGNVAGTGERGEVLVKGPQVFDGYDNDDEANARAFIDGWFRTGDEGFLDEDGYLTLTGRIKEMISRGGEKVSPAEVDAALMAPPAVKEAATFAVPHPTLGEEVAAVVVVENNPGPSDDELKSHLLNRLSGFKTPKLIVFMDEIPKSAAGKVQRHKLAEIFGVKVGAR
jgi:acyl-CoA synthetase (AMP-forming)/AMP-acid ligase II